MSWYAPGSGGGILVTPPIGYGGSVNTEANGPDVFSEAPQVTDESANDIEGPEAQRSEPEPTLAQWFTDNPGSSYEDAMKYMSTHSEEWAEKYLDYLVEKGELDRANQYTANREDTAYQRLVQDLRKAGLNPAMMYGSSASPSAGGSQGYVKMSEGANSRAVGNFSKIQNVLLAYMMYQLYKELGWANFAGNLVGDILNFGGKLAIAGAM